MCTISKFCSFIFHCGTPAEEVIICFTAATNNPFLTRIYLSLEGNKTKKTKLNLQWRDFPMVKKILLDIMKH